MTLKITSSVMSGSIQKIYNIMKLHTHFTLANVRATLQWNPREAT